MTKIYARLVCAATIVSFLSLSAVLASTQTYSTDRIRRSVDAADTAAVRRTAHPLARPQNDLGRVSPSQQLSGATLTFRLSPVQQSELNRLLHAQQDPSSPNYHKWLTPEQYASRFGMTTKDLAKVTAWLQSQGLKVDGISRSRTEISFSGSVGQIEYALKTELHGYSVNGEKHFANATDVVLPAAFSAEVLGVRGLNDFRPKPRVRKAVPRFTSNLSGNHFLIPGDFATIYGIPSNLDGTGQSIAVVGQTVISTTDIDAFRSAAGLPTRTSSNFQQITVTGTTPTMTCSGDETEADLDLEWSSAIAKNAVIKYVDAGVGTGGTCSNRNNNVFDALQFAVDNNVAPVISISYGNCEANLGQSFVLTMQQWAQQANAQGQTISGPSGDAGAADCELPSATSAVQGLAVDVPASIPEVTGVGATQFTGDSDACPLATCSGNVAPADQYWNGSSSTTSGASALSYIPETSWNNEATNQGFSAGGGGASTIFGKPSWQAGTGVPNDGQRDVPDVALNGSNVNDSYLICSQDFFATASPPVALTSCTTGFRGSDGKTLEPIGGTSVGAPTFAGILALINQATASNGLGNVNPMLYQLAATTPNAFHDVTSGTNKMPCTSGTPDCPSGTTTIGFTAGSGYDQVTGLGSLNVTNLIAAWKAVSPTPDFEMDGLVSTASAPGAQGTSTIEVTPENGFSGAVNLTCAPSSSTAKITCALSPTSVTLSGNGVQSATLTLSTVAMLETPTPSKSRRHALWFATGGTLFAAVVFAGIPTRRRRWPTLFCLVLVMMASLAVAVGCGGGSSSTGGGGNGTPAGTYSITVTGTSGATSHSTVVRLTVQ
jgi:subtilase family serine protease